MKRTHTSQVLLYCTWLWSEQGAWGVLTLGDSM